MPSNSFFASFSPSSRSRRIDATDVASDPAQVVLGGPGRTLRVFNTGTVPVCIKWGPPNASADWGTDTIMAPGSVEMFGLSVAGEVGISVVAPAGRTSTVYVSRGFGQ